MADEALVIIPARAGSRSIRDKNLVDVAGRPLVAWAIRAALNSTRVGRVVLATDGARIALAGRDAAHELGMDDKLEIFNRSENSATDDAPTEQVISEVLATYGSFDRILLIQPTSPLVEAGDIESILEVLDSGFDSALTCVRLKRFMWTTDDQGVAQPLNYSPSSRPRRQDHDGILCENGAVYGFWRHAFRLFACRLGGRIGIHIMPDESFLEIDEPADLEVLRSLIAWRERTYDPGPNPRCQT